MCRIMDEEARAEWVHQYPILTQERPGLYGAATARAEAQVMRLALIYALLDRSRRLSLTVAEACEALGVSWDFWREQVALEVRIVRRGRRKLVPVAELERWLDDPRPAAPSRGRGG